jgi:hypothetical protein
MGSRIGAGHQRPKAPRASRRNWRHNFTHSRVLAVIPSGYLAAMGRSLMLRNETAP